MRSGGEEELKSEDGLSWDSDVRDGVEGWFGIHVGVEEGGPAGEVEGVVVLSGLRALEGREGGRGRERV